MMKIFKLTLSLIILLFLPLIIVSADTNITGKYSGGFRGIWVATVLNIDYPSKPAADPEILKSEALTILDKVSDMGMNAVFLQVRPTADALYKSNYFPWSKHLTGLQGTAPDNGFDPLEFWVEEAHKRGIELHAWINPYRITKRQAGEPVSELAFLAPSSPARMNPGWVVKYKDGNLYFDPGIPEVRKLVMDGIMEIIENYDIDGIHLDDYFYPGKNFNDSATFSKYGQPYSNIDNWRRANVNTLVGNLSKAIKATGRKIRFGISPFGIWANKETNSLGSDTKGLQSYHDHYADTLKWVKDGTLDYIAPQLYWNIGYSFADYSKLLNWWKNAVSRTNVDLYIGQAAYRSGNSNPFSPWYGISEIERQLQLNSITPEVKGSIFFSYKSLADNPSLASAIKATYENIDGKYSGIPVNVSRPSENNRTKFSQFYLNGSSDPSKPLYLNGMLVENRSPQGYFGILAPLAPGANSFTFSQEGAYSNRVIFRDTITTDPVKMKVVEIPAASVFPQSQEFRMPGEKITLTCKAPSGSKVTVKLGGKTYKMKQSGALISNSKGAYPVTFTCVYTIPSYSGTPHNINLGTPVYKMSYKGVVKSRKAPAKIGVIMKGSPYYAKVSKAVIDTYKTPSGSNGSAYELYSGMTDYITGMTGNYVRLASGQWVGKGNVSIFTSKYRIRPEIKKAIYETGEKWDKIKLDITSPSTALATFDGVNLKLAVSPASKAVLPKLSADSPFLTVAVSVKDNIARYTLVLKKDQRIEGHYIEKTSTGAVLVIKKPVSAKEGLQPLAGITIMIDAGHGGKESGAIGSLGKSYAEKDINLKTALKLQAELLNLGASVHMTRTTDSTLSLGARLSASRSLKPDMFISLHANSMEDNVDISKTEGFSVFFREAFAKQLSGTILKNVLNNMGRSDKGVNAKNFYVIRGTWTPSILIESGFVPNPNEFEWLIDENEQTRLAKCIADAIVEYFKNDIIKESRNNERR